MGHLTRRREHREITDHWRTEDGRKTGFTFSSEVPFPRPLNDRGLQVERDFPFVLEQFVSDVPQEDLRFADLILFRRYGL